MQKKHVVLMNFGGPLSLKDVRGFLFRLFSDPYIISLPYILRIPLAFLISSFRAKKAEGLYAKMGGRSPIHEGAKRQKEALQKALGDEYEVSLAMRYSIPSFKEIAKKLSQKYAKEIILLPLYPQYSTSTVESSLWYFEKFRKKYNLPKPIKKICCFPQEPKFIESWVDNIKKTINERKDLLFVFSAHGIPQKMAMKESYTWHVKITAEKIMEHFPGQEYLISYQSRVGPLKWTGPYTEEIIKECNERNRPLVIIPLAFVNDHEETLVEIGIDFKEMATVDFLMVPALEDHPSFIKALVNLIKEPRERICPTDFKYCCKDAPKCI